MESTLKVESFPISTFDVVSSRTFSMKMLHGGTRCLKRIKKSVIVSLHKNGNRKFYVKSILDIKEPEKQLR